MDGFKPMLSAKVDSLRILHYPLWASPKIDGIRVTVMNGNVLTRSLKNVPNVYVRAILAKPMYEKFDGEICVGPPYGPGLFNRTTSAIMSRDGEPLFTFWVFDYVSPTLMFSERYERYLSLLPSLDNYVRPVHHKLVHSPEELQKLDEQFILEGYEGTMLRSPMSSYKFGRSTLSQSWLMKLKSFEDSDAEIIGVEQFYHNANEAKTNALGYLERSSHRDRMVPLEKLGALRVRDVHHGWEFKIGTGFTDGDRYDMWKQREALIGQWVKYRYQAHGMKDVPRLPVFLGIRDKNDAGV